MASAFLEHVNFTVSDPDNTAQLMNDIAGWTVRWQGPAKDGGRSVHVGTKAAYVALYARPSGAQHTPGTNSYTHIGGMNHIGIVVDDLEAAERKVKAAGYLPHAHADYVPGRRFYFRDHDGIEFEIVSYA